jgi:hypothetical protein
MRTTSFTAALVVLAGIAVVWPQTLWFVVAASLLVIMVWVCLSLRDRRGRASQNDSAVVEMGSDGHISDFDHP